jgi:hypothetical protein
MAYTIFLKIVMTYEELPQNDTSNHLDHHNASWDASAHACGLGDRTNGQ